MIVFAFWLILSSLPVVLILNEELLVQLFEKVLGLISLLWVMAGRL